MATWSLFPQGKLFQAMCTAVVAGIVLSALFIHSAVQFSSSLSADSDSLAFSSPLSLLDGDIASTTKGSNLSDPSWNATRDIPPAAVNKASPSRDMFTRAIWDAPVGTKMPDLKTFRLTKEMMEHRAKDNVIMVTFGNHAFLEFILNWVKHLTDLNVFNLLVGAMDVKLMEVLYWKGIPVFDMGSDADTTDLGWGTAKFNKLGREKVFLINNLLTFGYEFLLTDSDVVWLKNPFPYIACFPEADVLTSSDQVVPTVTDDNLEVMYEVKTDYNIGIFHWRPTDPAKRLAKRWRDILAVNDKLWDQNAFNDLVREVVGPPVGESGLVYAFDGTLKFGILPASIFCSGHTFFVQAMYQQLRLEPYVVHTTFQFSQTEGKRHRLREAMLFYDQPAYYDSPGGFLTFKPNIPKTLLLDGPHTLESHFSLVNYQLKQIRTALAIASLLNRTLVMPPLWCRLDRLWYAHSGILEGTMTRQPFLCPMDHVFQVDSMLAELPEEEFGPQIDFREYSFLQNPSVPKQVKESLLQVQLCDGRSARCQIANETTGRGVLQFPKHSTQEMFIRVFSLYKDVKVLKFSSMGDAFQGFTDKEREMKFRNRVSQYVDRWCCMGSRRGYIFYNMFWDETPGWKPELPKFEGR